MNVEISETIRARMLGFGMPILDLEQCARPTLTPTSGHNTKTLNIF